MSDFGPCQRRHTVGIVCGKPAVGKHELCEECRAETQAAIEANLIGLQGQIEAQRTILKTLVEGNGT